MKYDISLKLMGNVFISLINKDIKDNEVLKNIKNEYKNILIRAKDIGNNNNLITSYALAAFFISMNRNTNYSCDENLNILSNGMKKSKVLKLFLGNNKSYFSESKMIKRRKWSKETYKRKYENDWVVNVIEKNNDFEFGFDYLECGVCKLCKDEDCFDYAKYLCKLDYLLVEIIGIKLKRTKTIAEGYDKCDFRFKR